MERTSFLNHLFGLIKIKFQCDSSKDIFIWKKFCNNLWLYDQKSNYILLFLMQWIKLKHEEASTRAKRFSLTTKWNLRGVGN